MSPNLDQELFLLLPRGLHDSTSWWWVVWQLVLPFWGFQHTYLDLTSQHG